MTGGADGVGAGRGGRRWLGLWPAAYLAAVTGGVFAPFRGWAYDDPFITYRYAANLLNGLGFVYNPGERMLSTTTPLLTMILALLGRAWPDLPALANLLGAAALAGGGLCLWALGKSARSPWAGAAGLFLYPSFGLAVYSIGSETPLYILCCLAALACYARGRLGWSSGLCAGALLARPDGILVAGVLAIHHLIANRPGRPADLPWRPILLFAALTVPWFVFSALYFGSPLPATLFAKQQQGMMEVSVRFAPGLVRTLRNSTTLWPHLLTGALIVAGLAEVRRLGRGWALLFVWSGVYFVGYSLLGVTSYFWYYVPLVPAAAVAAGLGLEAAAAACRRWMSPLAAWAAPLLCLALVLSGQLNNLHQMALHPDRRVAAYTAVGRWLAGNTPAGASVGLLEVGIIGYYAGRPVVDFAGLIQPEVAAQLGGPATYDDAAQWAIARYRPDYVVLPGDNLPRTGKALAAAGCPVAKVFPGADYGFALDMTVYRCR